MLCIRCQRRPFCFVHRLARQDEQVMQLLKKLKRCEERVLPSPS